MDYSGCFVNPSNRVLDNAGVYQSILNLLIQPRFAWWRTVKGRQCYIPKMEWKLILGIWIVRSRVASCTARQKFSHLCTDHSIACICELAHWNPQLFYWTACNSKWSFCEFLKLVVNAVGATNFGTNQKNMWLTDDGFLFRFCCPLSTDLNLQPISSEATAILSKFTTSSFGLEKIETFWCVLFLLWMMLNLWLAHQ